MSSVATAPVKAFMNLVRHAMRKGQATADLKFSIVVRYDEMDDGWISKCIELPGAVSQGSTEREAIENLMDAIGGVLTSKMLDALETNETFAHNDAGAVPTREHEHRLAVSV